VLDHHRCEGRPGRYSVLVLASDDASDDVGRETAGGEEARLAGALTRIGGNRAELALPDRLGPGEFGFAQLRHLLGFEAHAVPGQFVLDARGALARRARVDAALDEAGVAQVAVGLEPVEEAVDPGLGIDVVVGRRAIAMGFHGRRGASRRPVAPGPDHRRGHRVAGARKAARHRRGRRATLPVRRHHRIVVRVEPGEPGQRHGRGALDITPVVIRCDIPWLTKGAAWWRVPLRRANVVVEVQEDLSIRPFLDDQPALAARRLTDHLADYFSKELARVHAAA